MNWYTSNERSFTLCSLRLLYANGQCHTVCRTRIWLYVRQLPSASTGNYTAPIPGVASHQHRTRASREQGELFGYSFMDGINQHIHSPNNRISLPLTQRIRSRFPNILLSNYISDAISALGRERITINSYVYAMQHAGCNGSEIWAWNEIRGGEDCHDIPYKQWYTVIHTRQMTATLCLGILCSVWCCVIYFYDMWAAFLAYT